MTSQNKDKNAVGRSVDSVCSCAENSLAQGLSLKRWWEYTDANDAYKNKFALTRAFNEPSYSFGFFDRVEIGGRFRPIMGEVEDRLFDLPKSANLDKHRNELREFVLRYLMRVSDFHRPAAITNTSSARIPRSLSVVGWCADGESQQEGFGYEQQFYKRAATGEHGEFPTQDRSRIVDLREIGSGFEWIVVRVRIFDFSFKFSPFGPRYPGFVVPLEESSYLVLGQDFIENSNEPSVDADGRKVIGRYGFGYSFIKDTEASALGYGPGQFDVAFQQISFRVYEDGETRVKLVFVANRPKQIANIPFAPLNWAATLANVASLGFAAPFIDQFRPVLNRFPFRLGSFDPVSIGVDVANLATGNLAAKQFCISREQLEKTFLVRHFDQHYDMINGALQTWREIQDWTDEGSLPEWVKTGVSS